ncbi:uncharacterized protein LOC126605838 [Malus sylvestris]|uniref:uncharacterized protein LOC126605838 n=1 Tax=Malus sylvestris TaxID=3752 RepID=UPI0021AD2DB2|nr:uncharacterized protein LOC126605838 [Malus sylvestris]
MYPTSQFKKLSFGLERRRRRKERKHFSEGKDSLKILLPWKSSGKKSSIRRSPPIDTNKFHSTLNRIGIGERERVGGATAILLLLLFQCLPVLRFPEDFNISTMEGIDRRNMSEKFTSDKQMFKIFNSQIKVIVGAINKGKDDNL